MNRLKHIRSINVSRHIPSNAALPSRYGQYTDVHFENRQFRSQVSGSDQLSVANKNHDVGIKYSKQFRQDNLRLVSKGSKTICKPRSRTKSSVTSLKKKSSMDKKLPLESIARTGCHYSTCQNIKFNSSGFNKRHTSQIIPIINDAKNINRHGSFIASVEKYPRSYAEMIADYSENLYKVSTVGIRNDSLYFDSTIRKSPFSTFSTPFSVKKIVNITENSGAPIEEQENDSSLPADAVESFDRCIQHNNINTVECHDFQQHHDTRIVKTINKVTNQDCIITNNLKNDDQSYAKLVADCSKSMRNISHASISNGGLVLSRNVLARNSLESFVTPRKTNSTNTQETLKTSLTVATIPLEKNVKEQLIVSVPKKHNWLKEIESVTSDLKSVIEKRTKAKAVNISKLKESDIPQFVDTFDNSLNKVHRLTKLIKSHKQKEKDTAVRKLNCQSDKIAEMEKRNKDFALQKHNYSQLSNKTSDPPQYFRSVTKSSPARKNSTHVSTSGTTSVLKKQPQVKLRMVPSEKESVVSINVDSVSTGLLDPLNPASKQLSVVVQSDESSRKEDPQSTENSWNVSTLRRDAKSAPERSDFGPMRISISEYSAPIKQIEFSINGKPVSELKSIIARTERLDVVSSMDKIEIRIPFAKDDANAPSKIEETVLSKGTDSSTGQILNVQISANFQNESTKGSVEKSRETLRYQYDKNTTPVSPSPISKSYYSFNESVKAREDTFSDNNMQQDGFSDRMDIKSDNMIEKNINEYKASGDIERNIQRETAKNLSSDKTMTDISLIEEKNNSEIRNLNIKKMMNTTRSPASKYNKNESSDHRVPSKIIPWWSSSDSFNKIRKKEEDSKSLVPPSSRNEKKAISNLNHNLVTESLPSKWKENSTTLTKKIQSINDATGTINNSSNFTSYSNSVEQCVESKPNLHYSYSFRLKPNKRNPDIIPDIIRNDLKTKDNQMSAVQEDKKIFGIRPIKPIPLSTFGVTNIGEHDISIKEKTSVLQKKTLNSAQNLPPKTNREKKDNYFLKQTKSIDDVFHTKSKIENISNTLKLIEKRKDTLIDYGLKETSRQPTVRLNSRVREIQNPPAGTITTKNSMSNTSATEMREQIAKTMKQTKLDETKKLEIKMDILKQKENLTIKNVATSDINVLNKNDVKNIQQMHQNDAMSSSSPNFRNSLKSTQTLKKQKLAEDTIVFQGNNSKQKNKKSLLEYSEDKPSSSSTIRISSETIKKSEKLGMSVKMPSEESTQNRSKSLSNIKNTSETIQEIEKLRSLTLSKLENNPSKESSDQKMINQKKSPLEIINEIQTKYNINTNKIANIDNQPQTKSNSKIITSKIENRAIVKNSMDKNAREMPDKFVKKTNKKNDAKDITARIVTHNPNSKDSLPKNCEKNHLDKSKSGKDKNPSGSAGSLSRKPNTSTGLKSADSKTKSIVMSNDNCTYARKSILVEALYPNFNRKDNTISNSQSAMFKVPRNLHNDMLEHRAPKVIGNAGPRINMDRPEKSMLYSAWLQRSRNDINKNEKLF